MLSKKSARRRLFGGCAVAAISGLLGIAPSGGRPAFAQISPERVAASSATEQALRKALARAQPATARPPLFASFADPPRALRPRVRYWVPQAAVTDAGIRHDIQQLAAQGFGGVELVAMSMPKGIPEDYAWGTPRWDRAMRVAADEAAKLGLSFSVANGPSWPVAMPGVTSADHPASLFELTYGQQAIEPGSRFEGRVPAGKVKHAEGTPRLVSLFAYPMTGERTLDASRAVDLTGAAGAASGTVNFTPPTRNERWMLMAFWGQPAAQKVGSLYVIDHFSSEGARVSAEYWDGIFSTVLKPGLLADIFNDSLEYHVAMDWTRDLPAVFRAQHGYDIAPYLPFIGIDTTYPKNDIAGFASVDPVRAAQVNQDYLDTLTALHIERHLAPLQAAAERHGANIRYQVGYNKPIAIETVAAAVGTPETEALGRGAIDGMRQMAAAVHILDKPEYSVESAAEFGNGYGQSLRDILWWSKRAWAAGVNSETLHGAAYDGGYDGPGNVGGLLPRIEWPGYHAFGGKVTNVWNRETSPLFSRTLTEYLARGNALLRRQAKVDVAIFRSGLDVFNDPTVGHGDGQALYPDGGVLTNRGFSYDFVSPALLALPQTEARDGAIAPSGPGYRALLVPDARTISLADLARFETFAARGVRILFVGQLPQVSRSYAAVLPGETNTRVAATLARLLKLPGVAHVESYAAVPEKLRDMGVRADAEAVAGSDVLAQHRVDGTSHLYYLYNYNQVSSKDAGTVVKPAPDRTSYPQLDATKLTRKVVRFSLAGSGRPYLMNAWSGSITPILAYTAHPGRVELTLSFKQDEAIFVALIDDRSTRAGGLIPARRHIGADHVGNEDLVDRDGRVAVRQRVSATAITGWQLSFAGVARPANGASAFSLSERRAISTMNVGNELKPLRQISPALRELAGTATYRARVSLPAFSRGTGGYMLDLGKVEGPYAVSVNGRAIEGVDQFDHVIDISSPLKAGVNKIEVRVATTLCGSVACDPARDEGLLGHDGQVLLRRFSFQPVD